jgi:hypothetical protein
VDIYEVKVIVPGEGTWCARQREAFTERTSQLTSAELTSMPSVTTGYAENDG